MPKKQQLYILITSNAPDVYVNVIRHCIEHFDLDKEIKFVSIYEDRDKKGNADKYLNSAITKVKDQLNNLSKGMYLTKKDNVLQVIDIEIEDYQKVKYFNAANNFEFVPQPILYNDLEIELKRAVEGNALFDVSGFQKDYLIDVYTILNLIQDTNIYYFKINALKDRTFDDKELIHNLHFGKGYDFENISQSQYTKSTVVKPFDYINELEMQNPTIEHLKDEFASSYSNSWMRLIRFILIISIGVFLYLLYQKRGDWNTLEPLTYIFLGPAIGWVINLLIQIIESNTKEALNLDNLQKWIKATKLKKIDKELKKHGT